jgi:signal recognition particle subunit SRP54
MTPDERTRPEIIDDSRSTRIARGSGTKIDDLRDLLKRFQAMRQILGQMGQGGGLLGKVPGLGKLFAGGGPDLGGLDPAALGLGGGAPNRQAARAMKAEGRRKKRKTKRKHMRRNRRR